MKSVRKPVITLICFLSCLLSALSTAALAATERLEVRIRSTILNIRETTSTQSPIVDVLQQGEQLTVTTTGLADWIRLDDGRGYISIHYVDVLSRTPVVVSPAEAEQQAPPPLPDKPVRDAAAVASGPISEVAPEPAPPVAEPDTTAADEASVAATASEPEVPQNTAAPQALNTPEAPQAAPSTGSIDPHSLTGQTGCEANAENTELRISSIATTCRKNLKTLYYEACDVTFNLEFISSCSTAGNLMLTCTAVAQTASLSQPEALEELQQEATIYLKEKASSRQKLLWMPASAEQQITDIQLRQKHCHLN